MPGDVCTKSNPCCFELRIGVLIVGIVWIVLGVSWLGVGLAWLAQHLNAGGRDVCFLLAAICLILSGIVGLASGIVLTIGVVKRNAQFVKMSFFGYIIALVLFVIFVILVLYILWGGHTGTIVGYIIWGVIFAAATVYALLVISAYWKQNN